MIKWMDHSLFLNQQWVDPHCTCMYVHLVIAVDHFMVSNTKVHLTKISCVHVCHHNWARRIHWISLQCLPHQFLGKLLQLFNCILSECTHCFLCILPNWIFSAFVQCIYSFTSITHKFLVTFYSSFCDSTNSIDHFTHVLYYCCWWLLRLSVMC